MDQYSDFTVDSKNYQNLGKFVEFLHSIDMHYVPIIDAGIKYDSEFYNVFKDNEACVMSAETSDVLIGKVWPGYTVFPDWFADKAEQSWH